MKQQKVIFESLGEGPIPCRIVEYYMEAKSTAKQKKFVKLEVATTKFSKPKGHQFWIPFKYVWLRSKYNKNTCTTVYEGKPTWDPDKTLQPVCRGLAIPGAN